MTRRCPPCPTVRADVVGQSDAVAQLRARARRTGPRLPAGRPARARPALVGAGVRRGTPVPAEGLRACCEVCRRALAGVHPDLVEVDRTGRRERRRRSTRRAPRPAPATRSAPPGHRCVRRPPCPPRRAGSVEDPGRAGRPDRLRVARRLRSRPSSRPWPAGVCASSCTRSDPRSSGIGSSARAWTTTWRGSWPRRQGAASTGPDCSPTTPGSPSRTRCGGRSRPDSTALAAAAALASELLSSAEEAVEPLRARHRVEMESLGAEAEQRGERTVPRRKEIEDRHHREERRWRTDELRAGFAVLATAYPRPLGDHGRVPP